MNGPDGNRFPWGRIVRTHAIGDYEIIEAVWDCPYSPSLHGTLGFFPYAHGESIHRHYRTLDDALVGVIAYRREGPNGRAAEYFRKMTLGEIPGDE
jgi:hypothetical protein